MAIAIRLFSRAETATTTSAIVLPSAARLSTGPTPTKVFSPVIRAAPRRRARPTRTRRYQLLPRPYQRKNAAYDSLEELHLVRGVGDDFWATFVDPEPNKPEKRVLTVWGQGAVNVNTVNPQTLLAVIRSQAVETTKICIDPAEMSKFLLAVSMVQGLTMGAPVFSSGRRLHQGPAGAGHGW